MAFAERHRIWRYRQAGGCIGMQLCMQEDTIWSISSILKARRQRTRTAEYKANRCILAFSFSYMTSILSKVQSINKRHQYSISRWTDRGGANTLIEWECQFEEW